MTTLADNLQGLETAINGGYDHFQEIWLQELRALITRVEHTVVEHMLLAEDQLPNNDDLVIIHVVITSVRGQMILILNNNDSAEMRLSE